MGCYSGQRSYRWWMVGYSYAILDIWDCGSESSGHCPTDLLGLLKMSGEVRHRS